MYARVLLAVGVLVLLAVTTPAAATGELAADGPGATYSYGQQTDEGGTGGGELTSGTGEVATAPPETPTAPTTGHQLVP